MQEFSFYIITSILPIFEPSFLISELKGKGHEPNRAEPKILQLIAINFINSIFQDEMTFNIGIGFNLANSEPTLSFNDLLKKQGLAPLDPETYFAKFFNCFEKFLDMLETDDGKNNILQLYHQYWLHQGKLLKGIDKCLGVKVSKSRK